MAAFQRRPEPPTDPLYLQLKAVRRGLLRLHKALIDAERAQFEQREGQLSNTQFLQALLQDPFFAWLRPFSGLIVEIDEVLATREPVAEESARGFLAQARGLVSPDDDEAASRYERVRDRDPAVLVAHVELSSHLDAAEGRA